MTSAISSFVAPVVVPQVVPQAASASPDKGFAQMLSRRQAVAHEVAARPTAADKPKPPPEAHAKPQTPARPVDAKPLPAQRSQTQASKKEAAADPTPPGREDVADAAPSEDAEPIDPSLVDWMAALRLPTPELAPDAAAMAQAAVAGDETAGLPVDEQGKAGTELSAVDALRGGRRSHAASDAKESVRAEADARDQIEHAAERQMAEQEGQAVTERVSASGEAPLRHETLAVAALGAAAHAPSSARLGGAAGPVAVSVPTPATSPEFAQSLGVQVSVLARDGVQQAELHLNPADMGPISVRIALDGTQAQVNFGADSAATRHIIESGLPELAAALRDAGFTLSGGGVHSQARGRGEGGDSAGRQPGDAASATGENQGATQRISTRVSEGGVDLYA